MRRSLPDLPATRPGRRARLGRRAAFLLLVVTTFGGLLASTTPHSASADELDDAYAQQVALQKLIAKQKAAITTLTANQATLSRRISGTKASLSQINANLLTVRTQIVSMVV